MKNVICVADDVVICAKDVVGAVAVRNSVNIIMRDREAPHISITCQNEAEAKSCIASIGAALEEYYSSE